MSQQLQSEQTAHPTMSTLAPDMPRAEAHTLNAAQIAEILPHRYPFALVDRILDYQAGAWAIGRKCVSMNEQFFCGHFPEQPVMPGVLVIEALAQVGAVAILAMPEHQGKLVLFGGIKKARFRAPITPGDVLELSCSLTQIRGALGVGSAVAKVEGKVVVNAELTFAVVEKDASTSIDGDK